METESAAREGLPVIEEDIKYFWKKMGKPSNSFPRINRKHNVSLVHMANVLIEIKLQARLSPEEASDMLQEKLRYNDKQMQEVECVRKDAKIAFEDFLEQCASGTIFSGRAG